MIHVRGQFGFPHERFENRPLIAGTKISAPALDHFRRQLLQLIAQAGFETPKN